MELNKYKLKELSWVKVVTAADKKINKDGASVYSVISKKIKLLPDIQYIINATQGGKFFYICGEKKIQKFKSLNAATKCCQKMYEKKLIKELFENV